MRKNAENHSGFPFSVPSTAICLGIRTSPCPGQRVAIFGNCKDTGTPFTVWLHPLVVELSFFHRSFDRSAEFSRILAGQFFLTLFDDQQTPVGTPSTDKRRIISKKGTGRKGENSQAKGDKFHPETVSDWAGDTIHISVIPDFNSIVSPGVNRYYFAI